MKSQTKTRLQRTCLSRQRLTERLSPTHDNKRRFVVGDVHGCFLTLMTLVEDKIQLQSQDSLYLLGDLIDRGPRSKAVLDYLIGLIGRGYSVHALRGNHEQMLLDSTDDDEAFRIWRGNGGEETLRAFEVSHSRLLPSRYLDFLEQMKFIYILEQYVMVHAGLDFSGNNPVMDTSPEDMLWLRDYRVSVDKLNGKTLITGHTMAPLFEIQHSLATNHIKLDNGCYDKHLIGHGNLVALNLDSRELLVVPNSD